MERHPDKKKLWFVLILAILITAIIYSVVLLPHIVNWDEAGYMTDGRAVFQALKASDLNRFFAVSRSQFYYPFFQSWLIAILSLIFGFSITSSRFASLVLLVPSVILIFSLGEGLKKRAGFYASLLFLTSPLSLFFFGSGLKEALGMFLGLLLFYFYFRKHLVWASVVLTLLTLTKYNYGVFPGIILGLEALWELFRQKPGFGDWCKNNLKLFGIPILVIGWWVLTPENKIGWFIKILTNPFTPSASETGWFGHLTFYLFELASSYTFSQTFFMVILVSFIFGLKKFFRNRGIRVLSVFFLTNLFLGVAHYGNQQSRFIFTSIFGFFIVAGVGFASFISWLKKRMRKPVLAGFLGVTLVVILALSLRDLIILPKMFRPTMAHGIGYPLFYEIDFVETRYVYAKSTWPHQYPVNKETIDDIFQFIFSHLDARKPVRQVGRTNEISPLIFDLLLALEREKQTFLSDNFSGYVVAFKILPGSIFDSRDYRLFNQWQQIEVDQLAAGAQQRQIAQKTYKQLGIVVIIYGE